MSDSLQPHRLYSPRNSPGQNNGGGILSLLQGINPTQESNRISCIADGFFTNWATREAWTKITEVRLSPVAQSCLTLSDPIDCSTPGFPVHHQVLELAQTHVQQVGNAIQSSHPLSSPSPSSFTLSQHQGLFQWVSSSHQAAKVLEFHLHRQSNEYSGLISFRMDWLDLLAVQGTLKSLLQHHNSKALIL